MRASFITACYVGRESNYALHPFTWPEAERITTEAFHGPNFGRKFDELCRLVRELGFSNIDLWSGHLNAFVATQSMIDEAAAILKEHRLQVVAYAGGLGRTEPNHPDARSNMPRADAEKVYRLAKTIGAPLLGSGLNPTNERLAYELGREYGIKYAIENHSVKTEGSPRDVIDRLRRMPPGYTDVIGIAQDTGFWGKLGIDAAEAAREFKDHLLHMHLKQVKRVGDEWRTSAFDDGVVDVEGVVRALKGFGYQAAISIEHEPHHQDPAPEVARSLALLRFWRGAQEEAGVNAR